MTRDDILRMVREAGMTFHFGMPHDKVVDQLTRFADLIAADASIKAAQMLAQGLGEAVAAEREECAKVCDRFQARIVPMQPADCAIAIRARSKT